MPDHDDTASTSPSTQPTAWPRLILGSTSPYRKELLSRLGLPFGTCAPRVEEQALPSETPHALALRLAQAKARDVAEQLKASAMGDVLVIGSDQVAELDGQAIGKPGTHERAVAQLQAMRGREVLFHTAVCVLRPATASAAAHARGYAGTRVHTVRVRFRDLSDTDIDTYLRAERPYDCAGSAKAESLGIVLLAGIQSDDPTALIGLPLIDTCDLMREAGADPLAWRAALACP